MKGLSDNKQEKSYIIEVNLPFGGSAEILIEGEEIVRDVINFICTELNISEGTWELTLENGILLPQNELINDFLNQEGEKTSLFLHQGRENYQ
jgi:hypothetical protein